MAVLVGLALRSLLSAFWGGHDTDMRCWIGWGNYIAQNGPATFYTAPGHDWYDYPPGYMLALGLISRTLDRPRGQDLTVAVPGNPTESLPCDLDLLLRVAGSLSCVSECFQQIGNPPFEDRKGCGPGL